MDTKNPSNENRFEIITACLQKASLHSKDAKGITTLGAGITCGGGRHIGKSCSGVTRAASNNFSRVGALSDARKDNDFASDLLFRLKIIPVQ